MKRDPDIGVAIWDNTSVPSFTLSPVPAKNVISLTFKLHSRSEVTIDLIDQEGKVNQTICKEYFPAGDYAIQRDISMIPAGLYFCRIHTDEEMMIKKLIIEK